MFIKRMLAIHQKAKEALELYRVHHQAQTDALVGTLRDLVVAYRKEGTTDERMAAMDTVLGEKASEVLQSCEEHLAHSIYSVGSGKSRQNGMTGKSLLQC